MNIIICDQNKGDADYLLEMVNKIALNDNSISTVSVLLNSRTNFESLSKNTNLYLVSAEYDGSGIELCKKIKMQDPNAFIVITSESIKFALEAFNVKATNYLIKPIKMEKLRKVIEDIKTSITGGHNFVFVVKTSDFSLVPLTIRNVKYIESTNRHMIYHLVNGKVVTTVSLRKKFVESVPFDIDKYNFKNCHSSYIVNMEHVVSMDIDGFTLRDGDRVPISKRMYTNVKNDYMHYITHQQTQRA